MPGAKDHDYEVIVIGGGFAGVTAARDLGTQGRAVLLLEARDRLGGRTWYRPFADTGQLVEFGGQWIATRWQPHVAREIERYGLPITTSPDPDTFAWLIGGERRTGALPVPPEEICDLERALFHAIQAARRLDSRAPLADPIADLDIPFTEFIAPLALPRATGDLINAWVEGMFGCDPPAVSTLSVLSWIAAYDYSALAVYLGESEVFARGTSSAIGAMIEDAGAEIRLGTPVRQVSQDDRGVTVTTQAGESVRAPAAVVAVPLNVLADLAFSPRLSPLRKLAAAEGHAGHATKVWSLVQGAPPGFYGAGQGPSVVWLATQHATPEGSLMVSFGRGPGVLDVHDPVAMQRNVDAFIPGAKVLQIDAHDWDADPYARGAWAAFRPGQLTRFASVLREPEGRLAFAGSDSAPKWAGWIEGAIASGTRAAAWIEGLLRGQ